MISFSRISLEPGFPAIIVLSKKSLDRQSRLSTISQIVIVICIAKLWHRLGDRNTILTRTRSEVGYIMANFLEELIPSNQQRMIMYKQLSVELEVPT